MNYNYSQIYSIIHSYENLLSETYKALKDKDFSNPRHFKNQDISIGRGVPNSLFNWLYYWHATQGYSAAMTRANNTDKTKNRKEEYEIAIEHLARTLYYIRLWENDYTPYQSF